VITEKKIEQLKAQLKEEIISLKDRVPEVKKGSKVDSKANLRPLKTQKDASKKNL
jgi:hypothetical protein